MKKLFFCALAISGCLRAAQAEPEIVKFHSEPVVFHPDHSAEQLEFERKKAVQQVERTLASISNEELANYRDGITELGTVVRGKKKSIVTAEQREAILKQIVVQRQIRSTFRNRNTMPRRLSAQDVEMLRSTSEKQAATPEQLSAAQDVLESIVGKRERRLTQYKEKFNQHAQGENKSQSKE